MRELRVGRTSRRDYELGPELGPHGELIVDRAAAARRLAGRINEKAGGGAPTANAGEIVALGLLHEVGHALIERYERDVRPTLFQDALDGVDGSLGRRRVDAVLNRLRDEFEEEPVRPELLESLLLLDVAAENPATTPIRPLVDPGPVAKARAYEAVTRAIETLLASDVEGDIDGRGESLTEMLRAPARHAPTSLARQLRYARERWAAILPGDLAARLLAG